MRVLLVSHDYLPNHPAGTEIYTAQIGARLSQLGHEVQVFTTEKDISRPHLRLDRREWEGLVVHELVNNLFYDDFAETWDWPPAVLAFGRVLDEFQPDVVHIMHLMNLSVGCAEEAHRRGLPIFYTLHDFWLQCARFGQRMHADGAVCHTIDFERCGTCLASLKWSQTGTQERSARLIAGLRKKTGVDLGGIAKKVAGVLSRADDEGWRPPEREAARRMEKDMRKRDAGLRERLLPCVERFFSPSRFLREHLIEWGIASDRIEYLPNGIDLEPFVDFRREPSDKLRVAFLGTLAPHKAPHLLVDAWSRLDPPLRAQGELTLHGPKQYFPSYVAALERSAAAVGAALPGSLRREEVPAALGRIDLLVVPSIWYENAPLTIQEARATRTPLLVSDLGGMAELVEPGRHGWRFKPGDPADLTAHLERCLTDPTLLEQLDAGDDPVPDMMDTTQAVERAYLEVLERSR